MFEKYCSNHDRYSSYLNWEGYYLQENTEMKLWDSARLPSVDATSDRTFTDGSEHKSEVTYPSRREFLRCGRPSALPRPNPSNDLQLCSHLNSGSDYDRIILKSFTDAVPVK